jgi:phage tail P2-like protein
MQTFSTTGNRISHIPVPIDTINTLQETPASVLPFLGWERSVDWNRDWPDQI